MFNTLVNLLPSELVITSAQSPNGPHTPRHPLLTRSLEFQAALVADLVYNRIFSETEKWQRCVGVYISAWLDVKGGNQYAESVRQHFHAIDHIEIETENEDGQDEFSNLDEGARIIPYTFCSCANGSYSPPPMLYRIPR